MFLADLEDDKNEDTDLIDNQICAAFQLAFVGRHKEREEIKNVMKERAKVVQIVGPPMIGKSALAEQITKELEEELKDMDCRLKIGMVPISEEASVNAVKLNLAHIFDLQINNSTTDFDLKFEQRLQELNRAPYYYYLVEFHNCEQCVKDRDFQEEFISIVMRLATIKRVVILLTSRVKFSFLCLNERLVYTKMLEPLELADAEELLKKAAPDVSFSGLSEQIVTQCDFFPYPIIMSGRKLQECQQVLTPSDLLEALRNMNFRAISMEFGSKKSAPETIVEKFIDGLEEHLKKYLAKFIYFPGSFSSDAAKCVADEPTSAAIKLKALLPLSDRCMIQCCTNMTSRFSVHSFIRKCAGQQLIHLRGNDVVRLRFAKFFGEVIIDTNKKLFNESAVAMLKYLNCDWQNIEHLLQEAMHPVTGNLYAVYMQVVKEGDEFLQRYVPEKCVAFYKSCLDVAEKFGSPEDVALLQSNIGCAISNSKGSSLNEAMSWYEKALPVLKESNYHSHYNKLLLHIGWNFYQQGQIKEAGKIHKGVMESLINDDNKEDDYVKHRLLITSCSRLALSLIFLRGFSEAKEILDTTLEYAARHVPYHPQRYIMMNSLGLIEQRKSHDMNRAIHYYKASLTARKQFAMQNKSTLIVPLNNLASALMILSRYDEAMIYIQEAQQICKSGDWEHTSTGLTLFHCGRLYYHLGEYEKSIAKLKEAQRIYIKCTPKHISLSKTMFYLGLAFKSIGYRNRALAEFHDLINNRESLSLGFGEERELLILGSLTEAMSLCSDDEDNVHADSVDSQLWNHYSEILEKELSDFADFHEKIRPELSTKYTNLIIDLKSQRDQRQSGRRRHDHESSTNLSMLKYLDFVY